MKPDVAYFKALVAKAIVFKTVHKVARPVVSAFLANVAAYTVALLSKTYGNAFDLDRVWNRQGLSQQFMDQAAIWAREVNERLHETAKGKMISEWAKRPECREEVFSRRFSDPRFELPEKIL